MVHVWFVSISLKWARMELRSVLIAIHPHWLHGEQWFNMVIFERF